MDKANWSFRQNTEAFLTNHEIVMDPNYPASLANAAGVYQFDIRVDVNNVARVRFANDRPARDRQTWRTHLVTAHWLPSFPTASPSLTVNDNADYFFTCDLSGCRVTITPGPVRRGRNYPTVRHIAGDLNLAARDASTGVAVAAVPAAQQGRTRSTSVGGAAGMAGAGLAYNGEGIVVGYLTWWGQWQFYLQDETPAGVRRLRKLYP